jgi:hypothetical protein
MRFYVTLTQFTHEANTGNLIFSTDDGSESAPKLSMKMEGEYIAISASYGPMEIALRPRLEELKWTLSHIQAIDGLQTSRQIGSSQSYLALGLRKDGSLIVRPTILTDATGYFTFNYQLAPDARAALYAWLAITPKT